MPECDGVEATAEIRKMKMGANIPIIACTGHAIESDAKAFFFYFSSLFPFFFINFFSFVCFEHFKLIKFLFLKTALCRIWNERFDIKTSDDEFVDYNLEKVRFPSTSTKEEKKGI